MKTFTFFVIALLLVFSFGSCSQKQQIPDFTAAQIAYGQEALNNAKSVNDELLQKLNVTTTIDEKMLTHPEAYKIENIGDSVVIYGGSGAGVMYGYKHLANALSDNSAGDVSTGIESPAMHWRGISLQLMKLGKYNWSITPEEFPFFYDKELWLEFLDFMVDQRFNYIILWNGHPFDYFVKFDKFKEAQSGMSDEQIQQNNQMLKWLIAEGGKRNIKLFFEFYNIHTSVYYQEAHQLPEHVSVPTPELAAYTEYSIAKFVSEFPEVGLFVTPGEGIEREYTSSWINDVIFKGIKSAGYTPTVFMRAWFFDLPHAEKIVDNYDDMYFVRKFNVEMIADTSVDPENAEWAKLNGNFVVNIHLAANLEPFRWNPPSYIKSIVRNNIESGAKNIHLHPRKAWRWPYGSDLGIKDYQWKRDTLFFTAWSRYAWNPDVEEDKDEAYWLSLLTNRYGNADAARHAINASEAGADVLPGLQRLVWLGHDNHTIISAGITIEQLMNAPGAPFLDLHPLYTPKAFVEQLKTGEKLDGISPIDFLLDKIDEAKLALSEAELAYKHASANTEELRRIVSDAQAQLHVVNYFYHKMQAVKAWVLQEQGIDAKKNKEEFLEFLAQSVEDFKDLCKVTEPVYETMSDVWATHPVRLKKVPYHWNDMLVFFEQELEIYKEELETPHTQEYYQPSYQGLAGILYGDPHFMNPEKLESTDKIDFNWDNNEEIGKNWSYKWNGFLKTPKDGKVTIKISSDREILFVLEDGNEKHNARGSVEVKLELEMKKDVYYPIELLYDHAGIKGGHVRLEWQWPDQNAEVITQTYFYHSEAHRNQTKMLTLLNKAFEEDK